MSDEEEITLGSHTNSDRGDEDNGLNNNSDLRNGANSDDEEDASPPTQQQQRQELDESPDGHEPVSTTNTHTAPPSRVLTNYKSPTTTQPPYGSGNTPTSYQQLPAVSDQQAAAIGQHLIRALSGEDMLEGFLRKYPRPTPGSGVGVGPIKSTTQGTDRSGRQRPAEYLRKRALRLREKRSRLRELQEWEFQTLITPPRRANSAAVGLLGFGMTFVLLGLHFTGHFWLDTVLPGMMICLGGGVQMISGFLAWTQGLTFAYVSFVSGGGFFLALTCLWMLPNSSYKTWSTVPAASDYFTGVFFCIWGVYNFCLLVCTPRMNLCILMKVLTTCLCFLCLGGGLMAGNKTAVRAGGYLGIVTGSVALYLCFASLINEVWDRAIMPIGQFTTLLDAVHPSKTAEDGEAKKAVEEERQSSTQHKGIVDDEESPAVQPAVQPAAAAK